MNSVFGVLAFVLFFRRLNIGFQIGVRTTIWTLEARPAWIDKSADTLVVPHVRAWSNKKSLTWSNRIQADGTLGAVGRLSVGVFSVVDLCLFEDIFVCCSAIKVSNCAIAFCRTSDETYLNWFKLFCQPLLHSIRILTQRKMTSSPPLKSMPS